ncbi:MAG: NAD(P)H-dependent oxidoreductase subunit E [Planctomycetaceae bacterium]|nr:NAD(P)H-dependent oxidoreductase subunit E [Planctomycetaceae bacterium]
MLEAILEQHGKSKDALLPILQAVQKHYRYLPQEVLEEICRRTEITPSALTGIATFYDQFRHKPTGEHIICVCTGTACHVKGAEGILNAFRETLQLADGDDTDKDRQFTVQKVACLGCCTLAPVVQIDGITYGHLTPSSVPDVLEDFQNREKNGTASALSFVQGTEIETVKIGLGSCCQAQGSAAVYREVQRIISEANLDINIEPVGCVGMCHQTPLLETVTRKKVSRFYAKVQAEHVKTILLRNYKAKHWTYRFKERCSNFLEELWSNEFPDASKENLLEFGQYPVSSFLGRQQRIAMDCCGEINPIDLADYQNHNGFRALKRVLTERRTSEKIIAELETAGLRGRGGAGFPTFKKWEAVLSATGSEKYIVCNGDEGDPGAFMDRMLLESFPFRIIEGISIAAYTVGARQGFFYIRAEYPLAVERIRNALKQCYENNLLGENILGSGFSFDLSIKEGAGAFVCGEETALLESMEGRRGMPRLRPPFPAVSGLYGKPTLVNNVETYSLVPFIFSDVPQHGAETFAKFGTEKSKGTKVFSLAGKVKRGGLIEVPMGITVREIVEEIGGGTSHADNTFKAVQIGGPSGGCVPEWLSDTSVDYESLAEIGAIMGSGGLVVLDNNDCMVDIARYFLSFTQEQSCGKCTFCRVGTRRMLDILENLCSGKGKKDDLNELELLARQVKAGSFCGLGKTAPNPVLSTLKYFRSEYEEHLKGRCPAGKCLPLIEYRINGNCNGCSMCSRACAAGAIPSVPYQQHRIISDKCTKCGTCLTVCPHKAVERS